MANGGQAFGGQAFPRPYSEDTYRDQPQREEAQEGMALRDYFAAAALPELIADAAKDSDVRIPSEAAGWIASEAYDIAEAMIEEREKR